MSNFRQQRLTLIHRYRDRVQAGETLRVFYCVDCALCDCPGTHSYLSIPCIPIAQTERAQRCLLCNTRWSRRDYRWQAARRLRPRTPASP